ncbi:fibronectin type III domain-containing protein [Oscillospiraceae bacterium LTW-04]|nr:fibronectin type III domain-containing protein [Oscillospiraceae bacterium MB24-C1]
MRDMANPRGGRKQIWVVLTLSLVLVVCVGVLLWLVWSEPNGLPASISQGLTSESEVSSSRASSSSKPKSSSKNDSSSSPSQGSTVPSSRPVQHSNEGTPTGSGTQKVQNLTINAALTHDENATYYNVFINADGVTLKNKLVKGDLVISESVANGTVTLENIVVKGRVLVNGAQTVTLHDVTAVRIVAQRGSGTTDYIVGGASTIHQMTAKNQLTIDEGSLSGNYAGIKKVTTERGSPMWQQVTLSDGALDEVTTNDATNLILSGRSSVGTVIANAPTHIGGSGLVNNLTVCSDDVSYEREPRNVTVKDDYDKPSEQNWAIGQTETAANGGDHSGGGVLTLSTPRNLTITAAEESSAVLAFNSVSNATSYTVIYSVTNGSSTSNITNKQLSVDTNSCTITNALIGQAGTVITFKVRAVSSSSRYTASAYSDFCSKTVTVLGAPTNLQLNLNGNKLAFSFTAAPNATAYSHEAVLSVDGADIASLTLASGVTFGEFSGLASGKTHTVTVRATGDENLALTSAPTTDTYDVPPLSSASGLAISNEGGDLAVIFTGAAGISDYTVTLRYDGSILPVVSHRANGDEYTYLFECPYAISAGKTYTASVMPQGGLTATETRTVGQRTQPSNPRITSSELGLITFAFDSISGYNYKVVSATKNGVAIPGITASNLTAAVSTAEHETFNFSVKTLGDGMFFTDSAPVSANAVTVTKLPVPLSPAISGDQNNLTFSFNTNNSHNTHNVVIQTSTNGTDWTNLLSDVLPVGITQKSVETPVTSTQVRFSVTAKAANALQIDSDRADSPEFSVVKLQPAAGLSVSYVTDSGYYAVFSFDEVLGATGYTISYTLDGITWVSLDPVSSSGVAAARAKIADGKTVSNFTVTAQAMPDAAHVYLDSTANYLP